MASTISATYGLELSVVETFDGQVGAGDNTLTYNGLTENGILTASSSVPATKQASGTKLLSGGAGTLDMTALPGKTADETVDATGLKLQLAIFHNLDANANTITVTFGAANPYLLGGTGFKWILSPGDTLMVKKKDSAPDVAAGAKDIDLAGTGAQGLEYHCVFG